MDGRIEGKDGGNVPEMHRGENPEELGESKDGKMSIEGKNESIKDNFNSGEDGKRAANEAVLPNLEEEVVIPEKLEGNVRFMTFNINGFNTLFNYYPWNKLHSLQAMFLFLKTDVISLQELKTSRENVNNAVGKVDGFYSFISLPVQKKGYSGVGVYIRKPTEQDSAYVKGLLAVKKVEEGISGYLRCYDYKLGVKTYKDIYDISRRSANSLTTNTETYKEMVAKHIIGGYANLYDRDKCLELDSQGRCIVVELGYNVVVFSVYCPANSQRSDLGEAFRLDYIKLLFARVQNLAREGKKVVLMGDVNISRDLIDQGEYIQRLYEEGKIVSSSVGVATKETKPDLTGEEFESLNKQQVVEFTKSTIPRIYLNSIIYDSYMAEDKIAIDEAHNILQNDFNGNPIQQDRIKDLFVNSDDENSDGEQEPLLKIPIKETVVKNQFLHDLVREYKNRQLKMYTCWNTIKNYRSINFGSRIDLILCCDPLRRYFTKGDILPHLNGSDHCPVYCDFALDNSIGENSNIIPPDYIPKFEAKYVYGLNESTIINMFKNFNKYSMLAKRKLDDVEEVKVVKKPDTNLNNKNTKETMLIGKNIVYTSRKQPRNKGQKQISSFFKPAKPKNLPKNNDLLLQEVKRELGDGKGGPLQSDNFGKILNNKGGPLQSEKIGKFSNPKGGPLQSEKIGNFPNNKGGPLSSNSLLNILSYKNIKEPLCHHKEPCILRTSTTEKTKGKKFWCCRKVSIRSNSDALKRSDGKLDNEISCGYFEWA